MGKDEIALDGQDALLLVDVQNDFCPGGALPVPEGDAILEAANEWIARARRGGATLVASLDHHPADHLSFHAQGGAWPAHCVIGTPGAALHPGLKLPHDALRVLKGTRRDRDQYSAFDDTGLAALLRRRGVRRVLIGGLAEDVCVKATALDAAAAGFETLLLTGCTRALTPQGSTAARDEMRKAGVKLA